MQKTCILWSRQHVTAKMVISLKLKQNIDILQHATLKSVHLGKKKTLKIWFHVNVRQQRR